MSVAIWEAFKFASNCTGVAALVTGLFLVTKGKSDLKLALRQLEHGQQQADRDDDRDDRAEVNATRKEFLGEMKADRDDWMRRAKCCEAAEQELNRIKADWLPMGMSIDEGRLMIREWQESLKRKIEQ